jgi:hypothetical protein
LKRRKQGLRSHRAAIEALEHRTLLSAAQITVSVYNDLNGDNLHATGEPGMAGQAVFLDTNNNGILDADEQSQPTDVNGQTTFSGLDAGTYHVQMVIPSGWVSLKGNPGLTISLASGQSAQAAIELVKPVNWSTLIYNDLNFNQTYDSGDKPLAGAEDYIDANNNGILDAGEVAAITNSQGMLTFHGLLPGSYTIRHYPQPGWQQSTSIISSGLKIQSGQTPGYSAIGDILTSSLATATGTIFDDFNGNGVRDANEPALAGGWTIYVDSNHDGLFQTAEPHAYSDAAGDYKFQTVTPGTYTLHATLKSGWKQTGSLTRTFVANAGAVSGINFGFQSLTPGLFGTLFNDLNANTSLDSTDTRLSSVRVFLDLNKNSILDAGEPSTLTNSTGGFQFTGLAGGTYRLTQVPPTGLKAFYPVVKYVDVAVAHGQSVTQNLADIKPTSAANITGMIFNDLNGDKARQSGEPGLSGWQLYLDLNLDNVRQSNEPLVTTNSSGVYTFSNMATGRYLVRPLTPSGWRTINFVAWWATSNGSNATGLDFAASQVGKIGSKVYIDSNGNGQLDANETPLSGFMVYIDSNKDGKFEVGERYFITDSFGQFYWDGLAPGTYLIRVQQQPGYTFTTPSSYSITLGLGQFVVGYNFGESPT